MAAGLDRDALLGWCRQIDDGPWSTPAVGERIAYPNQELFATLAAAAAVTERVAPTTADRDELEASAALVSRR